MLCAHGPEEALNPFVADAIGRPRAWPSPNSAIVVRSLSLDPRFFEQIPEVGQPGVFPTSWGFSQLIGGFPNPPGVFPNLGLGFTALGLQKCSV